MKDKIKENKVFLVQIICGIIFILLGIIQILHYKTIQFFNAGYILIGIMYILLAIKTSKLPKTETVLDERFISIRNKAGFYAFFSIIIVVMILSFVDIILLYDVIDISSSVFLIGGSENAFPLMLRYIFISSIGVMIFVGLIAYYRKRGIK
ncbi:MAG: hypothetical protein KAR87_00885, partial [Candidatus Aenigmarchaeota archaeon]|nr:hypothetical protein [Candidatus Aenigmarchaeota archaeon]